MWVLTSVLGLPAKWALAQAVDFKTYLKGAQAEISRHKEIIREDSLNASAYFELGRAYLAMGRHEEEVEAYREAIKLNPKYTAAHYNLSMAYDLLNDGPNAIKHMLRAQRSIFPKKESRPDKKGATPVKSSVFKISGQNDDTAKLAGYQKSIFAGFSNLPKRQLDNMKK